MNFIEKLTAATRKNNSLVCVGLDPDPKLMPEGLGVYEFNKAIIDATADIACAYKPNFAFYEALGDEGIAALKATIKYVPSGIPVIGDAKRGDIGNTSKAYATALFEVFKLDGATISPYLGFDGIEPFLQYKDKGLFILCRTSNSGAVDFQSLKCKTPGGGTRCLYEIVAAKAGEWNKNGNIGLVVGATYPEELKIIREQHPSLPFLIPGVGAQGGEIETTVKYGTDKNGERAVVNSSRGIIYASRGKDFAPAARKAAMTLRDQLNAFRPKLDNI